MKMTTQDCSVYMPQASCLILSSCRLSNYRTLCLCNPDEAAALRRAAAFDLCGGGVFFYKK